MVTVALCIALALLLLAAFYISMARLRNARIAYLSVAWVPLASLLLIYSLKDSLERALGYGVIILGMLMAAASLLLGLLGAFLLIRSARRGEPWRAVAVFTAVAFVPVLVYLSLLLR